MKDVHSRRMALLYGDCRARLREIASGAIDLVVTSPPYNAGKSYEAALTLDEYGDFAASWIAEISRLLKPTSSFWLNIGYMKTGANEALPLSYLYYPIIRRVGLKLVQEIVWYYEGGLPYRNRFAHRSERWLWFSPDPEIAKFDLDAVRDISQNTRHDRRNHALGKNPTDVWYYDRVVGGTGAGVQKTAHPCQFPVAMIDRIIRACTEAGDVVLDPFMGSGTAGEASLASGRNFIGVERDAKFYSISKKRLRVVGDAAAVVNST